MTARQPNVPSGTAPEETDLTLSITAVWDSEGVLVGQNRETSDTFFKVGGTAEPNKPILVRDGFSVLAPAQSDVDGIWKTELFEVREVKRYSLTALGDYGSKPVSTPPRNFTVVADAPIIESLKDEEGTIDEGATTYYRLVNVTGKALPNQRVQAFNGSTPLEEAPVSPGGDYTLELKNLLVGTSYTITVKALYGEGKTSEPRSFAVAADIGLSLDAVGDSDGNPVNEGDTTSDQNLTVVGKCRPGKNVQLLDHDDPEGFPPATAKGNGEWEIKIKLDPGDYELKVQKLYGDGEVTPTPRTFTVKGADLVTLDTVTDPHGKTVDDGGFTYESNLIVRGEGEAGEYVEIFNGDDSLGEGQIGADGYEVPIGPLPLDNYRLVAKAKYPDGGESGPYSFEVRKSIAPRETQVHDAKDEIVDNGHTTSSYVRVGGKTEPLSSVNLKVNGTVDPKAELANEDGNWATLLTGLEVGRTYVVSGVASDDHNAESNKVRFMRVSANGSTDS
ncbi:Fibronectin type-III domain-containing protein [Pseudomonas sp. IT-P44]|uniref:hypothetical protein n=1 Tax=unclassified Pseudomonas TaxID=196821 RepID=UPI00177B1821|nr:hypothetical protein [Pseudomonas sp. PDM02]MBD9609938.1 hypothetical protein [Pseudomonas sp. PDM02]